MIVNNYIAKLWYLHTVWLQISVVKYFHELHKAKFLYHRNLELHIYCSTSPRTTLSVCVLYSCWPSLCVFPYSHSVGVCVYLLFLCCCCVYVLLEYYCVVWLVYTYTVLVFRFRSVLIIGSVIISATDMAKIVYLVISEYQKVISAKPIIN